MGDEPSRPGSPATGGAASDPESAAGGEPAAGGSGASPGGSAGGSTGVGVAETGTELVRGSSILVDVFAAERGVYVITTDAVALFDRQGAELVRISAARDITAAAFDGATLVVADRARLTSYDARLSEITSSDLAESCSASVLVSGARFVCGPSNDWQRVFYTYDSASGALLATSNEYTYNGIPMRRVPGTDDFVTVTTTSSPSDFHLYSVVASGEATFVNESPYHGDFRVTGTYAFFGEPATHLVTDSGLLLRLYGEGCTAEESVFSSECFIKDGELGTLSGSQVFRAMDSASEGKIYGLVDPSPGFGRGSICDNGCLLERIDVAARQIEAQTIVHLQAGAVVAFRHDASTGGVAVGYRVAGDYYFDDPYPGYRVVYFEASLLP